MTREDLQSRIDLLEYEIEQLKDESRMMQDEVDNLYIKLEETNDD